MVAGFVVVVVVVVVAAANAAAAPKQSYKQSARYNGTPKLIIDN